MPTITLKTLWYWDLPRWCSMCGLEQSLAYGTDASFFPEYTVDNFAAWEATISCSFGELMDEFWTGLVKAEMSILLRMWVCSILDAKIDKQAIEGRRLQLTKTTLLLRVSVCTPGHQLYTCLCWLNLLEDVSEFNFTCSICPALWGDRGEGSDWKTTLQQRMN